MRRRPRRYFLHNSTSFSCIASFTSIKSFSDAAHRRAQMETEMSALALDLLELNRLARGGAGALTETLRREVAMELIAEGVRDEREGC